MAFFESVKIRDLISKGFKIPENNNMYNSEAWFLFAKTQLVPVMRRMYGRREVFDTLIFEETGHLRSDAEILEEVEDYVDSIFTLNTWKYRHLFELYNIKYNPIWNVDGIEEETVERDKKNTGTQENTAEGSDTLTRAGSEARAKTGHDDLTRTGNEVDEPTGTETLQKSGSITETNGGGVENSRTTFDSAAYLGTDKSDDTLKHTTAYGKDIGGSSDPYEETQRFALRKDTHTYNNVKDQQDYNSTETISFTGRVDTTGYGRTDTRTDDLTENENVRTIRNRQGNIGVTTTQKMMNEEIDIATGFNFLRTIAEDIVTAISYSY